MRSVLGVGVAMALVFDAARVLAGDVHVTHPRCAPEVHVVARDAPFSAVLKELASVLDFQFRFDSDSDPRVTLDASPRAEDLLARIGPSENVTMMLERDPHCAGQQRIVKVWVLPGGSAQAPRSVAAIGQPDEQARLEKQGAEMILRAHGMDPSGQPLPQ